MARRSSKPTGSGQNATSTTVATPRVFALQSQPFLSPQKRDPFQDMGQHDRRRYNPTTVYSGPASTTKKAATQKISGRNFSPFTRFNIPEQVALCVRRKIRRQVIHAITGGLHHKLRKYGKAKKHRNQWSGIRC